MDNKKSLLKKKSLSIQEEKLIRKVDYDSIAGGSTSLPKGHLLLEILHKIPHRPTSQKVLVSIKPRTPAIKTLYIAEKSRFHSRKHSDKSRSRLAIGDHSSLTTHSSADGLNINDLIPRGIIRPIVQSARELDKASSTSARVESSKTVAKCSHIGNLSRNLFNIKQKSVEKCYVYTQSPRNINLPNVKSDESKSTNHTKVDISTLIITNTPSEVLSPSSRLTIDVLNKRIDYLERKILRQEMVFRSIDPSIPLSSPDEESKVDTMKSSSGTGQPGCSYIQQYSHIPGTSAFQRYAQQMSSLSTNKATNLEKEHNSEQYGRDFTAYDGITARTRRQSASVPYKRGEVPKVAAERMHKIRHKLNPVRDYRLMDTVHYLAQGEFAPRDDGIKLTPSREAVLSDIIWEDVCRTHWPSARLGRRVERYNTRFELQQLIDSLLRERVAHVERRRRRHYRIVKLNHRHESCRPMGKTGDIIVASHKNRHCDDATNSDDATTSAMMAEKRWEKSGSKRAPRSYNRLVTEGRQNRRSEDPSFSYEDSPPGTSYAANGCPSTRKPTCCYQTSSHTNRTRNTEPLIQKSKNNQKIISNSSSSKTKCPRLVVKKDLGYCKHHGKDEPNLEHYILLPTLVVRTPSNMKRQKKFNELYHRILNVKLNNAANCAVGSDTTPKNVSKYPQKKDIGLNIKITLSNSSDQIHQRKF